MGSARGVHGRVWGCMAPTIFRNNDGNNTSTPEQTNKGLFPATAAASPAAVHRQMNDVFSVTFLILFVKKGKKEEESGEKEE